MSTFLNHYTGHSHGVLRWPQLDKLWAQLATKPGWYLYEIGRDPPTTTVESNTLKQSIREIDTFLRTEHDADYCGVVYADDLDSPQLLKIYHPKKMGASCGNSGSTVLPKWTLSKQPPTNLIEWALERDQKPAWWKHLLRKH